MSAEAEPTLLPGPVAEAHRQPNQDWRVLLGVFWVTSMVEGLGVSQIFALLPTYLRQMGVPDELVSAIARRLVEGVSQMIQR